MASGLHFRGLEICEAIPKSGPITCLGQNKRERPGYEAIKVYRLWNYILA